MSTMCYFQRFTDGSMRGLSNAMGPWFSGKGQP